ncbi:MAG TPA: polysaccharide biosynthesis/export family protein, partial [Thermodesulfobacteriota bacterium]|nr:polysaccharide biosynthesis/export family protein [Thermodesulfobacteriota bacterium]
MRTRRSRLLVPILAGAVALGGCATATPPAAPQALLARAAGEGGTAALNARLLSRAAPLPPAADLPLGPGDLIEVSVFDVRELSGLKVRVSLQGLVTFPLLGSVRVAGLTPIELEEELRARLRQAFMHDPQVSVFVLEQRSQRLSIVGAVRNGGLYPVTGQLRLADALALAGGLTDDADHVVYLIRRAQPVAATGGAGEAAPTRPVAAGATSGAAAAGAPL